MLSRLAQSARTVGRAASPVSRRTLTATAAPNAAAASSSPAPPATRTGAQNAVASTSAVPYDPAQLPAAARQQQLVDLRNAIFGTHTASQDPSSRIRDGSKILKQRLQGPALLRWYGERYTSWSAWNQKFPGLDLVDLQEQQR